DEFKCDKRKTSVSIGPCFIRLTTLIDDPHPTSVGFPSITRSPIVINTDSPESCPSQTTPLSLQTSLPPFSTPTNISSSSSYSIPEPSTVIPMPSLTITDQIITQIPHRQNSSVRIENYSNSSPFDY
ncbi:6432_t:CDS:1, partial [Cetraspora pellucida]